MNYDQASTSDLKPVLVLGIINLVFGFLLTVLFYLVSRDKSDWSTRDYIKRFYRPFSESKTNLLFRFLIFGIIFSMPVIIFGIYFTIVSIFTFLIFPFSLIYSVIILLLIALLGKLRFSKALLLRVIWHLVTFMGVLILAVQTIGSYLVYFSQLKSGYSGIRFSSLLIVTVILLLILLCRRKYMQKGSKYIALLGTLFFMGVLIVSIQWAIYSFVLF
jgi:hypothetical protein